MAKKAADGQSQTAKIQQMIEALGWEADLKACAKYLKDTFGLDLAPPYISQLRSNERKKRGMPSLRSSKGGRGKAKKAKELSPAAPGAKSASAVDITTFVMELTKWQEKLGAKTVKDVLQTLSK